VYRARDARIGRDVAVKVLPERFSKDQERLRRFEQEARAAGTLNHPNVLTIFDVGSHEDMPYVVSELLEGVTLGEELKKGPLPIRKAIDYAAQVARGLAAAHDKGIFHRDLKPDNIFITSDGRVKILDFGLAKLSEAAPDPAASAMPTAAVTGPGVVMGTVGYMSPEQIRGVPADHRSDIFSFGTVLYEMLSGNRAFTGDSAVETMHAILKEDPPEIASSPNRTIPPALDRVIRHCLEKNREQRFQSSRDLTFALETVLTDSGSIRSVAPPSLPVKSKRRWFVGAAALVLVAAMTAAGIQWFGAAQPVSWSGALLGGPEIAMTPRISPDGKTLAFVAMINNLTQVAVMDPTNGNWSVLTQDRSRGAVMNLEWSADGSRLYFDRGITGSSIFSVPALGGDERLIVENAYHPLPLPDGSLIIAAFNEQRTIELYRFSPETGKRERLGVSFYTQGTLSSARVTRNGREIAFFGWIDQHTSSSLPRLYVGDIFSKRFRLLTVAPLAKAVRVPAVAADQSTDGWVSAKESGDLSQVVRFSGRIWSSVSQLMALTRIPRDLDIGPDGSLYVDQMSRPQEVIRFGLNGGVPEQLAYSERVVRDEGGVLMLEDGRVLYADAFSGRRRLVAGRPGEKVFPFVETSEETFVPAASAGEGQVACVIGRDASQTIAIVSTRNGQIIRRLKGTTGKAFDSIAASPDGKTLYFVNSHSIWAIPASDGEPLWLATGDGVAPSPDGSYLIIQINEDQGPRLAKLNVAGGDPQPIPLDVGPFRLWPLPLSPNAVAPDGRIIHAVDSQDSWFESAAVIDPRTGRVQKIETTFSGDIHGPGWTKDGRIIATGLPTQSSLWRFRPEK
jgi:Tol biopolymer transport system component